MRKPRKATDSRVFLGIAGLLAVAGLGLLYTAYGAVGEAQARVDALKKEGHDGKQVQAALDKSSQDVTDLRAKLAHLELGLSDAAYVPTMLKELETSGRQQGIDIVGVRPMIDSNAKSDSKKPYDELNIELKGRGSYGDVMRFVRTLNNFPKVVAVRTVTLAPVSTGGPNVSPKRLLDATIGLRAYVFKSASAAKAGGSV